VQKLRDEREAAAREAAVLRVDLDATRADRRAAGRPRAGWAPMRPCSALAGARDGRTGAAAAPLGGAARGRGPRIFADRAPAFAGHAGKQA
jgi:hypothetical protein